MRCCATKKGGWVAQLDKKRSGTAVQEGGVGGRGFTDWGDKLDAGRRTWVAVWEVQIHLEETSLVYRAKLEGTEKASESVGQALKEPKRGEGFPGGVNKSGLTGRRCVLSSLHTSCVGGACEQQGTKRMQNHTGRNFPTVASTRGNALAESGGVLTRVFGEKYH